VWFLSENINLTGKIAIVTGGTRGIGLACAEIFASAGATVVVVGRNDLTAAKNVASSITNSFGTQAIGLVADARNNGEIQEIYKRVYSSYGGLDVLVNNAGVMQDSLLGMITPEEITNTLEVNAAGVILHLQSASRLMRRSGGSIVNVASVIGRFGNSGQVVYSASKAAVIGATLSAAKELACKKIRVNAVAPGLIRTDMTRSLSPEVFDKRLKSIGLGQAGTTRDVAGAVLFLASDYSSYITGQVLGVDGGMII
jgi:3-oxoacyl-[acyl-carrier protein] reductase